jgi:hypothetical protein
VISILFTANHAVYGADSTAAASSPNTDNSSIVVDSKKQSVAAALSDDVSQKGFSFFLGFGAASVRYQETSTLLPLKTSAQATNIILNSGALYALNKDYLFSIENQSTFYPQDVTESWNATAPFSCCGYSYKSGPLQQDNFSIYQSDTHAYLYKRLSGSLFLMAGPSFGSSTFKRSSFVAEQPGVNVNASVVEESSSEILGNIGIGIDSEQVNDKPSHYSFNVVVGLPVWRRVTNTGNTEVFAGTQGYDVVVEGRYSWAIRKELHIGAWARYSDSFRGDQVLGGIELPQSQLESESTGLELLWKL